jgi:tetratricopeptide (TPR) repeat protein
LNDRNLVVAKRWSREGLIPLGIVIAILAGVWFVFGQTGGFDFVDYYDTLYVTGNSMVLEGLTWDGVRGSFWSTSTNLWHPLTWISHQLDVSLFGGEAGGHHLHSVLLHALTSVLVFALFRQLTGRSWCSAFVALLFALHPLRAESVAWVSERKDVLSAFFWVLTCLLYVWWVRKRGVFRYGLVLLAFVLGMMAKPSVIMLPLTLLLLDYWPLGRMRWRQGGGGENGGRDLAVGMRPLIWEKLPLFLMAGLSMLLAFYLERTGSHVGLADSQSWSDRLASPLVTGIRYLRQSFYPLDLSPYYPLPVAVSVTTAVTGALVMGAITIVVCVMRRSRPWLFSGWFWYLIVLAPMSGLVPIAAHYGADRYTYVAHIGLCVAVVWSLASLGARLRIKPAVGVAVGVAACIVMAVLAHGQVSIWRNANTLWRHAIAVGEDNYFAYGKLAVQALRDGREQEGIFYLQSALKARPGDGFANANMGVHLKKRGEAGQAVEYLRVAVGAKPGDYRMRYELADSLDKAGRDGEALAQFRVAAALSEVETGAHVRAGALLFQRGDSEGAIAELRQALGRDPGNIGVQFNLGYILGQLERYDEALEHLRVAADEEGALRVRALYAMGGIFMKRGDAASGAANFRRALELAPGDARVREALREAESAMEGR